MEHQASLSVEEIEEALNEAIKENSHFTYISKELCTNFLSKIKRKATPTWFMGANI